MMLKSKQSKAKQSKSNQIKSSPPTTLSLQLNYGLGWVGLGWLLGWLVWKKEICGSKLFQPCTLKFIRINLHSHSSNLKKHISLMPKACSLVKQDFWDPKITQVYNLVFKVVFITLGTKFAIVYA